MSGHISSGLPVWLGGWGRGEFYLWPGTGAIMHPEDFGGRMASQVVDLESAVQWLKLADDHQDWSLWHQSSCQNCWVRLVAVKVRGQVIRFDHELIDSVT